MLFLKLADVLDPSELDVEVLAFALLTCSSIAIVVLVVSSEVFCLVVGCSVVVLVHVAVAAVSFGPPPAVPGGLSVALYESAFISVVPAVSVRVVVVDGWTSSSWASPLLLPSPTTTPTTTPVTWRGCNVCV